MNPIVASIVTGALVIGGKFADGKTPNMDNAIGIAGVAIGLSVLDQFNTKFAQAFGVLIVVAAALVHFPKIARATGLGTIK